MNISRRNFITKAATATAVASTLGPGKALSQLVSINQESYDYIVVGSGAGGGPLACRLAKAGFRVLVIEAGPNTVNQNADIPALHLKSTEDAKYSWDFFVKHYQDLSAHGAKFNVKNQGMFYPRASAVGGCTIHNAMIPIYPNNSDMAHLQHVTGDAGFSPSRMRDIYQHKVLEWLSLESTDPTLAIGDKRLPRMFLAALREGLKREGNWAVDEAIELLKTISNFDPNSRENIDNGEEGLFLMPKMTKNGKRYSTRTYLMDTQALYPNNLFIVADTLVNKVIFAEDRSNGLHAIGVECFEKDHIYEACPQKNQLNMMERFTRVKTYRASREVIIAGGAFNSPQLLMLSGIGEEAQLRKHGIKTLMALNGVGKNLQDRYEMSVVNDLGEDSPATKNCTFGEGFDPCMKKYQEDPKESIYSSNGLVVGLKVKSDKYLAEPDLMIFGGPVMFTGYFPGYAAKGLARPDTFTWAILKGQTKNRSGEVRLNGRDPLTRPDINFRYFSDGASEDMRAMVEGLNLTRRIVKRYRQLGLAIFDFNSPVELFPGTQYQRDSDLVNVTRKEAWGHHASCSNKMGRKEDPMSVVGADFKVHGTKNLRVVDASVFPKIPGLFIAVPTFMMAEKAAIDIIRQARLEG